MTGAEIRRLVTCLNELSPMYSIYATTPSVIPESGDEVLLVRVARKHLIAHMKGNLVLYTQELAQTYSLIEVQGELQRLVERARESISKAEAFLDSARQEAIVG